jgi:endonuclease-3
MDTLTASRIFETLAAHYSDAWARKRYRSTPFQVLITTILSAQTTDKSVDAVRDDLFSLFPDPESLAMADITDVERIIHSTGFYHMKARHITAASKALVDDYSGEVPDTLEKLITLPGVGRKTANIVLYHAFGRNEGVAVDTHVFRLAGRIGFSDAGTAEGVERDLMQVFPQEQWGVLTDLLIAHGRAVCQARNPRCPGCPVRDFCRYFHESFLKESR